MTSKLIYAIIGAGHGGRAMAADLACRGHHVCLYNRTWEKIEAICLRGGIELREEDGEDCFGRIDLVTSDLAEALAEANVIMVVVPASAHRDVAVACASHLRAGQVVVLHPGRTGGALEFRHTLREEGSEPGVLVAEAETFIFASRSTGPAESRIFRRKNTVPVAALPARDTPKVLEALTEAYPQFIPARNVLHTSLNNMGAIFHPALTILNAARIENTQGDFQFYVDGVTPAVGHVLEVLDRERVTVAASLGVRATAALEWLERAYGATGNTLHEAMISNPGYRGIQAPRSLRHRYIFEDVPFSLVPISSLGERFGVSTTAINSMINLASIIHGVDYYARGRTVERMGLGGLRVGEITHLVEDGGEEG